MNKRFIPPVATLILIGIPMAVRASDVVRPASREGQRPAANASASAVAAVDVQSRPLEWIAPGTVIGDTAAQGWTNLVLIATPRIGVGDIQAIPRTAVKYSSMFHFTILANVRSAGREDAPSFYLDKVAIGSALEVNGKNVIATSDQSFGSELGFIGQKILQENENILRNDVRQVLRTRTMLVFDAQGFVLYNKKHARMVMRHVILVSPRDGKVTTFVWLMGADSRGGYALAERALQLLPPNMHEDRVLSVDANKFTLGIPSNDAFALAHIPQGTPIKFTPELSQLAVTRLFTPETATQLEAELQTRYAPILGAAKAKAERR
jgi:hypothetical protein